MHSMVIPIVEFQAQIHKIYCFSCLLQPRPKKMLSMEAMVVDVQAARIEYIIYFSMTPGIKPDLFELSLDS